MTKAGKKIAIFDDDEDILAICTFILEEAGWNVISYTDCNDPVEKLSAILPNVILMDNWIPDTGGILATQALKRSALLKHTPLFTFRLTPILDYWPGRRGRINFWQNHLT